MRLIATTTRSRGLCAGVLGLLSPFVAAVQEAAPTFADYNRAVWTASDGAPLHVRSIAQTPDGWLWIGTPNGLVRFDGMRFHRLAPTNGTRLLDSRIWSLSAQANGDLYIGYEGPGLSVLRADGRLEHLAPATRDGPIRETNHVVRDRDGGLWAGTAFGLWRLRQGSWSKLGPAQDCPDAPFTLGAERGGKLWAASFDRLFRIDRAASRCVPAAPLAPQAALPKKMVEFTSSPDGRLWAGADGQFALLAAAPADAASPTDLGQGGGSVLFDRSGHLWALRCPTGLCLAAAAGAQGDGAIDVTAAATSRLDRAGQLGSLAPRVIFEDRDGDIWLGLPTGLERFRRNTLRPVGLPAIKGDFHIAPDADGSVWLVAPQERRGWRYDPVTRRATSLAGSYRGAMAAPDGSIVFLKDEGIVVRRAGVETRVDPPGPLPPAAWARGDGERVWLGGLRVPVQAWDGQAWRRPEEVPGAEFVFSAAGLRGQMWRALADGRLLLFEDGRVKRSYDQAALGEIGEASCVASAPELVVCGEAGVSVMHDGRFRRLQGGRDEVLRRVTGMLVSADGTRWLNGDSGVLRVEERDWRLAVDTGAPLRYTLLDARDGYSGTAASVPSLKLVNGQLWVATTDGILAFDPARRERSAPAPQPELVAVSGDALAYPLAGPLVIQPGTRRLRFDFTAPALSRPERIAFSYRLDGVDETWQTGSERSATYTGLAPGDYRFRLRAMNGEGAWAEGERTLALRVAPTLVQTVYFKLACLLGVLLLLWLAYRLRLRFLTRALTARLSARIEERERIARELHDTVMQTFQGFVMKATAILPASESALADKLRQSLRDARTALEEGREKIAHLRAAGQQAPALHDYLLDAIAQDAAPGQQVDLRYTGQVRRLHPAVEQEFCAMGREALRNALQHAHARSHEVIVEYGAGALVLTVRDDGRGFDAGAPEKPGHWGLRGIAERARLIHADVRLETALGAGTTWRIQIRAALAYTDGAPRRL